MEFTLSTSVSPPTITLTARGELDIFSARTMSRELNAIRDSACPHVLVDVSGVSFVDASALGVLARTVAVLDADHTTMGFVDTTAQFRRLCSMTGLELVFGLPMAPVS